MVRPMLTAEDRERGRRLGALLRAARADRSMGEVAAASGVPVETLRKIETGRIPTPAFFTVAAIAAALDLPLETLAVATAVADTSAADPRSA
jgi:transcriptional regulator with XRE-family HTH domain